MRRMYLWTVAVAMLLASDVQAGVIYYSTQASFNAASTGLSTQTFAAANVAPGGVLTMNNTLNTTTNNGIFSTGNILPNLSLYGSGFVGSDLAIVGAGYNGFSNNSVFSNWSNQSLNIAFSSGVTAASLGLLSFDLVGDVTFSVYNTSNVLLGSATVFNVTNTGVGTFYGVTTTGGDIIGRIEINSLNAEPSWQGVDRVQFGTAVPVPGSFAMMIIGIGSCGVFHMLRRRKISVSVVS